MVDRVIPFPPQPPVKLVIEVGILAQAQLAELMEAEGLSQSMLINRAVALYYELARTRREGGHVYVRDAPDGQLLELGWATGHARGSASRGRRDSGQ